MGQEHRRNVRSPVRLMAFVKNTQTGKVQRWLTKNLSGTGLCLETTEHLERGTRLEIELKLPDCPAPFVLPGEVVWTSTTQPPEQGHGAAGIELGVLFVELSPKVKAMLNQYAVMNAPPELG